MAKTAYLLLFWSGLIGILVGAGITVILDKEPVGISKILIVQNGSLDAYTLVKSQEVIARVLKDVSSSQTFIKNVYSSNFGLREQLPNDPESRLKFWHKHVNIGASSLIGSVTIETKSNDYIEALKLNSAILYTIDQGIKQFYGNPQGFKLAIIDPPYIVYKYKGLGIVGNAIFVGLVFLGLAYVLVPKKYLMSIV